MPGSTAALVRRARPAARPRRSHPGDTAPCPGLGKVRAAVEPVVAHVLGVLAAEEWDHAADVVAVDVSDDGDVDVPVFGVEPPQPLLQHRPRVRWAAVDQHSPWPTAVAKALHQQTVTQPRRQYLYADACRHGFPQDPKFPTNECCRDSRHWSAGSRPSKYRS